MKNNLLVYLYGAIIILEGIFLLFSEHFTFNTTRYTLGIVLIIGAILALSRTFIGQRKQVQFAYHEMHALAMFVYGAAVLLFANNIEILIYLTSFLLLFYAFSEIIFCIWLFNLKNTVKVRILFIRIFLAFVVGIGSIILINYYNINKTIVMQGYGILFAIIGSNILLYEPVMNRKALPE